MHNGRPFPARKTVQLMLFLTILAWATQTLFAQWSRGAEIQAAAFVPRDGAAGGTLELRAEARVQGGEVKLKQVCRWSAADAVMFAPVADVVLAKLEPRRPYKMIEVREVRQMLEDARINVARVRFSGPLECKVSRTDAQLKDGEALEQWINATDAAAKAEQGPQKTSPSSQPAPAATQRDERDLRLQSLRDLLAADLAVRLSVGQEQLVLSFDPRDDSALNLSEPQFKFNIQPRRVRDLGEVAWDVTITGPAGSRKAQIRGTARAWQNQVVAARPMARRQLIQDADVTQRRTLVDRLADAALLKTDQVVGQMAGRDLKPGTVLTAPLVEAVPLAKVGQFITVTLERGTVRVKSVAKALEGGCYGQTIRVKNEATKDVYQVILTGPQEASMASPVSPDAKRVASAANH
jgi:flagella basal body P-ring formation protein FlgA